MTTDARREYMKKWEAEHAEERKAYKRKWQQENGRESRAKVDRSEYMRAWKDANKEKCKEYKRMWKRTPNGKKAERAHSLKAKYGITLQDYDNLLAAQNGVCAICGTPPGKRRLAVDHDHKTGAVRGLLCVNCNVALGRLQDNVDILQSMIEYIERH